MDTRIRIDQGEEAEEEGGGEAGEEAEAGGESKVEEWGNLKRKYDFDLREKRAKRKVSLTRQHFQNAKNLLTRRKFVEVKEEKKETNGERSENKERRKSMEKKDVTKANHFIMNDKGDIVSNEKDNSPKKQMAPKKKGFFNSKAKPKYKLEPRKEVKEDSKPEEKKKEKQPPKESYHQKKEENTKRRPKKNSYRDYDKDEYYGEYDYEEDYNDYHYEDYDSRRRKDSYNYKDSRNGGYSGNRGSRRRRNEGGYKKNYRKEPVYVKKDDSKKKRDDLGKGESKSGRVRKKKYQEVPKSDTKNYFSKNCFDILQ